MKKILLIALLSSLVMGCGSDSDSSNDSNYTPAVPPTGGTDNNQGGSTQNIISKGFYEGTTTQGQDVIGLVSDSNELWFLYSEAYKNSIGGFIKGNINPSKDTTKFNVNDYNISTSTNYKATLSNKVTLIPRLASDHAVIKPATPAPMTTLQAGLVVLNGSY